MSTYKYVPQPTSLKTKSPQVVKEQPVPDAAPAVAAAPVPPALVPVKPTPLTAKQAALVESRKDEIKAAVDNSFVLRTGTWRAGISTANEKMRAMVMDVAEEMQSVAKDKGEDMEMRISAAGTVGELGKAHVSMVKMGLEIGELDHLAEKKPLAGRLAPPPQQYLIQANSVQVNTQGGGPVESK